MNFEYLVIT